MVKVQDTHAPWTDISHPSPPRCHPLMIHVSRKTLLSTTVTRQTTWSIINQSLLLLKIHIFTKTVPFFDRTDGGAAYGTAKAGMGIGAMGVMHPQLVMRNIIPVVMAGVLGIYGLIVSVILLGSSETTSVLWIYIYIYLFLCRAVA